MLKEPDIRARGNSRSTSNFCTLRPQRKMHIKLGTKPFAVAWDCSRQPHGCADRLTYLGICKVNFEATEVLKC